MTYIHVTLHTGPAIQCNCLPMLTARLPSFTVLSNKNVARENRLFISLVLGLSQAMIRTCKINGFWLHFGHHSF